MKLTDKIYNRESLTPFYTFEFFPPRTEQVCHSRIRSNNYTDDDWWLDRVSRILSAELNVSQDLILWA
jgi:hypothetical protein